MCKERAGVTLNFIRHSENIAKKKATTLVMALHHSTVLKTTLQLCDDVDFCSLGNSDDILQHGQYELPKQLPCEKL